ncbi:MAG: DEAD/DEAH box helicase family protein [Spirochaetota bacterium]|nr:DEAD/DEAH box helicase family protein [Spirochaetota bacterium]
MSDSSTKSNFIFLKEKWLFLYFNAVYAEKYINSDPNASCFYSRITLEAVVNWLYDNDPSLEKPYSDNLGSLIEEHDFKELIGETLYPKIKIIQSKGNSVAHSTKRIPSDTALQVLKELYHFLFWFYRTYTDTKLAKMAVPNFNADIYKVKTVIVKAKPINVKKLNEENIVLQKKEKDEKEAIIQKAILEKGKKEYENEIKKLKEQIALLKKENQKIPDTHDYNESDTRRLYIDTYLEEAGWNLSDEDVREYPVVGMPNESGKGYVDYVLWGDDGLPLAVVEAKKTTKDANVGKQQAKLYADCLERMKGQRPIIYYTNSYDTYLWDDLNYPPRLVQGFYKKDELHALIQKRTTKKNLKKAVVNKDIAGRYYQNEAIQHVIEHFEEKHRKALIVMATGSGKTRTAIALTELLMRNNWVKRVLFLADRNELVRQARNAFKQYLPQSSPEIITSKKESLNRVCLSTYPTIMNCIDKTIDGKKLYSTGHFDLIIIDEAHRSIYEKYKEIFNYFDSLLVGLTATPRKELDRNTYELFDIENGNPNYFYELDKAVKDGVLVPPKSISVPLKFQREGIKYSDLSPKEQEEYEIKLYDEDTGEIPDKVLPAALNKWLFNMDTVDKVLKHLMENGLKIESGDKLGKTIIFAKNHKHAEFICERFDYNYPHLKGSFCRVIDNYVQNADSLIDDFKLKSKDPFIAVSVDMLDTGIDVHEIVNLIFFKIIRSKTKFHQMIGRGTRLCPNLFGPSLDKEYFMIFDYCGNFEFFEDFPDGIEPSVQESLSRKIFRRRLSLAIELQNDYNNDKKEYIKLKDSIINHLHYFISKMNTNNFMVKNKLRYVEKYQNKDNWKKLTRNDELDLIEHISNLPSETQEETESSKQFDFIMLNLQIYLLEKNPNFNILKVQVIEIASHLENKQTIPQVEKEIKLILNIQRDEFWENINLSLLEEIRIKLRSLTIFIDKKKQKIIYTNFTDGLEKTNELETSNFGSARDFKQYRLRVERFINEHLDHIVIHKIKNNMQITSGDLNELENILYKADELESKEKFEAVYGKQSHLGVFIRGLVGLDRKAAINEFNEFLNDKSYNSTQIYFINQIINYLTKNGVMDPKLLYESPFTDTHYQGVAGLFQDDKIDTIIDTIHKIKKSAIA